MRHSCEVLLTMNLFVSTRFSTDAMFSHFFRFDLTVVLYTHSLSVKQTSCFTIIAP